MSNDSNDSDESNVSSVSSDHKTIYALVGGGSGGHLTPLIPVAEALKARDKSAYIVHIGQKQDPLNSITVNSASIDKNYTVSAGKYRRYNGENLVTKFMDLKTLFLNVRDFFRFLIGIVQSWFLLGRLKPSVIFMKGGYVCAPVGIAAGWRGIPYITHDSDSMVSLAHRLIAKRASLHTTAMNPSLYKQYNQSKTKQVGVPVRSEFRHVTPVEKAIARKQIGYTEHDKILLVIGGGLGAKNINDAVLVGVKELLIDQQIKIIHITGNNLFGSVDLQYKNMLDQESLKRVKLLSFSDQLFRLSAASDVIITRAGATNMAEFAAQGKPCIIVPNPLLAGGHQLKNAEVYLRLGAAIVVAEQEADKKLVLTASNLLNDKAKQEQLSKALYAQSSIDAAPAIAELMVAQDQATNTQKIGS